jgi:hypothetical protein
MAYETVYDPVNSDPFEVPPQRASNLVLNKGWTRTPWTRVEPEVVEDDKPARGRGRKRRAVEAAPEDEAPIEHEADPAPFDPWRS